MPSESEPPIVGIGASAGGVKALQSFFEALPDEPDATFVVVVHLDPEFRSQLASILSTRTRMPVSQVEQSSKLRNNHVYVIPPNCRLLLADHTISAVPFAEPRSQRAPIDSFFRSLAEHHTDGFAYAVILTGAGTDGAMGVKSIRESGGIVLVQDPNEAEYPSMPRSAIAAEVADFVLPIHDLTAKLVELLHNGGRSAATPGHQDDEEQIRRILAHLRVKIGHDFTLYKRATILRRIARRLQVTRKASVAEYYAFLRENAEEAQALFSDFLISVTTFFRDADAFNILARDVIPHLFDGKEGGGDIRVWVPGCATGEEAYTIGILLLEEAARQDLRPEIHVFGSDLDANGLAVAREGRYPATIEGNVSEDRLHRFFQREGDHYRVRRELRDIVLFASHSLLRDPPFSRLDMISCRNLLIYLDRELQQQVCATFHYALLPGGALFLGASESADNPSGLFRPVDRDARIYRAVPNSGGSRPALPILLGPRQMPGGRDVARAAAAVSVGDAMLHRQMLERVAPPSMLVDDSHRAVHLSEHAGRFLQLSGGPVSTDATEMVREELRFDLRTALDRAFDREEPSLSMPLAVRFNGSRHRVHIQVKPVLQDNDPARYALVLFIEGEVLDPAVETSPAGAVDGRFETETVRRLRGELQLSDTRLRATRDEAEAANEGLRAANEELQSINEEYRSTSEELETSKEELQSINEELQTVNNELKLKLESVSRANSDLQNLMAASDYGTLFLDPYLRIKRFTPRLTDLFNITASDEGRPVTDFTHQLDYSDLADHARAVLQTLVPRENEVQSLSGGWYLVRIRPYRTIEDKIDGVVASFIDITERKRAAVALRETEERLRQFGEASSDVLWIRDADTLQWEYLSSAFESIYGLSRAEALAGDTLRNWADLIVPEDRAHALACIERVRQGEQATFEYRVRRPVDGRLQWLRSTDFPIRNEAGTVVRVGGIGQNVTELKAAEAAVAASEERLYTLISGIPQLVWRSTNDGLWTWASQQWLDYSGQSQEASHGMGWMEAVHPDDRQAATLAWDEAHPNGTLDVEFRVRRASDGAWRWHATRSMPVWDAAPAGEAERHIVEWLGTTTDIEDLKRLQGQQAVLVAELQHRTRNLLAVARSVAKRSIEPSPGRDEYDARLAALGRVQGFLSRSRLFTVPLADLVDAELQATGDRTSDKVRVDGPPIELPGEGVQAVALALHELATNALKYGALAQPAARLSVTWRIATGDGAGGGDVLLLDWRESAVAMPAGRPARSGYGTELITKALPYQLNAKTTLDFTPDGLWCRIELPAGTFTSGKAPADVAGRSASRPPASLPQPIG